MVTSQGNKDLYVWIISWGPEEESIGVDIYSPYFYNIYIYYEQYKIMLCLTVVTLSFISCKRIGSIKQFPIGRPISLQ